MVRMMCQVYSLLYLTTCVMARASPGKDEIAAWVSFKKRFNRAYSSEEDRTRRDIFLSNLNLIRNANTKNMSTIFGVTPFADMSPTEFASEFTRQQMQLHRHKRISQSNASVHVWKDGDILPASVDWESEGATTAIQDENQNG